jgi:hypothetical protein
MSVLDRVHRRQTDRQRALTAGTSGTDSPSSIQAVKPAVIRRLEYVVGTLHNFIAENDDSGTMARFSFITRAMIEEIGEELAERDEETLQYFMAQIGEVIAWIGHGDPSLLPENLRGFVDEPGPAIEQTAS